MPTCSCHGRVRPVRILLLFCPLPCTSRPYHLQITSLLHTTHQPTQHHRPPIRTREPEALAAVRLHLPLSRKPEYFCQDSVKSRLLYLLCKPICILTATRVQPSGFALCFLSRPAQIRSLAAPKGHPFSFFYFFLQICLNHIFKCITSIAKYII